jgi:alkylation response protein AidB-like acyl-CoA dehydrogenase
MEFELMPQTPAGDRFVKLAEDHAPFIAERADEHDRKATFPFEAFDAFHESGLLRATVPEELGGLGLSSMRDLAVGLGRLARGDGSVAFALNNHLVTTWRVARTWRESQVAGMDAPGPQDLLERIGRGALVMSCIGEPGTDHRHPLSELVRLPGGGWELSGRKSFAPLAPAANLLFVYCRSIDDAGAPHSHWALVPKHAPGVQVLDVWDALGLRAAGSEDLVFERVRLEDSQVLPPQPWGEEHEADVTNSVVGIIGLVAALLGIAERAHELALQTAWTRTAPPDDRPLALRAGVQQAIAQSEIDLLTARAVIDRAGRLIDHYVVEPLDSPPMRELRLLNAQFQSAKLEVSQRAMRIVDRSLDLCGGSGYLEGHPLSRLCRDVRVGSLLQPYPANEAHEYIGRVALGFDPTTPR